MGLGCVLYKEVSKIDFQKPLQANAGLWFHKFPRRWSRKRNKPVYQPGDKHDWLSTVEGHCGSGKLVAEFAERQVNLIRACGGIVLQLTNESRFVTGLGIEHPIENGFAWHHVLGTPYMPASGLKGLLRAWAESDLGADVDPPKLQDLFGHHADYMKDTGVDAKAGRLILLDLLPMGRNKLVTDVLTPHYTSHYKYVPKADDEQESHGDNNKDPVADAPGDWHNPVPVPFLACEAGGVWQTGILPGSLEATSDELELAKTWLLDALAWFGAGAKTAVGYGRFIENPNVT